MEHLTDFARDSRNIQHFYGLPCHLDEGNTSPCLNGGTCRPFYRSFVCKCGPDHAGQRCEQSEWKYMAYTRSTSVKSTSCLSGSLEKLIRSEIHVLVFAAHYTHDWRLGGSFAFFQFTNRIEVQEETKG